ncbi:CPBP family intramembrane glutamic endopeptidase [Candidatus Clostridium radicumherbarum]|uniref:CPBP family intramembrane glutamic endopeptidase n=1 Tax=Candidatus Clostridium radicumherbarum TaxID=3381662 RepID=A0ABW8TSF1_9CLOT
MNFIKGFFTIDKEYKDTVEKYNYKDGISAITFYLLVIVLYYVMGVLYGKKNLYLGYEANLFLAILCILFVLFYKQPIKTIGFGKKNLSKSLILGLVLSAVLLIINLILGISGGYRFNTASKLILNFGYYFFVIALVEEIIFRGFIQTRIYGIIEKPFIAVIVTAFMFMAFHIPFQMGASHMKFLAYVSNNYITLLFTFLWHIVFNFLYTKYNSIAAPTVFHAVMDWCNVLFK